MLYYNNLRKQESMGAGGGLEGSMLQSQYSMDFVGGGVVKQEDR